MSSQELSNMKQSIDELDRKITNILKVVQIYADVVPDACKDTEASSYSQAFSKKIYQMLLQKPLRRQLPKVSQRRGKPTLAVHPLRYMTCQREEMMAKRCSAFLRPSSARNLSHCFYIELGKSQAMTHQRATGDDPLRCS